MKKKIVSLFLIILIICTLAGCGKNEAEEPVDPHEGQVRVYDGYDYVWMTPLEGVERNTFTVEQFTMEGDTPVYSGNDFTVKKGIDVSEHQLDIDWATVKNQGLDFVFVRCGYRGYTEGGLHEDIHFKDNMDGAKSAGLDIGIYFTTQAITAAEAIEEAEYVLDLIKEYDIKLPVCLDWEKNYTDEARAENLSVDTLTNCAVAFLETIKKAGYEPCIYYNRTIGYYKYDLTRLTDYTTWFSLPVTPPDVTFPSFLYHIDIWQYSISGTVNGIPTEVDLDYIFTPNS